MTVSLTRVSPMRWPGCGSGVTAQTPGDAALGPLIVRRFLPPAWRPRGRQHREEDKQPLIWAPQAASLFPSTPALTAPGTAGQSTGSSPLLGQHRAGRSGRAGGPAGLAPGTAGMPAEGMRDSGASRALSVPGEGSGLQHYVRIR